MSRAQCKNFWTKGAAGNSLTQANVPMTGLTETEAQARLRRDGPNELPRVNQRTPFRIVLEVLREPMLMLLVAGGGVYLALGVLQEALILLICGLASIVITVVQESRTERVLEALRDLTSPRALVIRDGERKRIAGRDVVRGDLIVLSEGDRVPADGLLWESQDLQADESLLTGESVPVRKLSRELAAGMAQARPGGDDLPQVFSGALIVRGSGIAEVSGTGPRTEIGKIGQTLSALESEPPRLQGQVRQMVRLFAIAGGSVSVLAVVLYGFLRGGWLDAVLAGIALGMSMLPEEFPVVLTVFMAMGAWRISKARVLTRKASAIETLGSATVLCTDKTGTLTENRMTIAELRVRDGSIFDPNSGDSMPLAFEEVLRVGVWASAQDPFDPMERAFHDLQDRVLTLNGAAPRQVLRAYSLTPDLLAVTQVWENQFVASKGAPEAIARLCRLSEAEQRPITLAVEAMAAKGLRVLGVARAVFAGATFPESPLDFQFEFLGLVGLADPLRASVPAAVAECRTAGMRIVMITGDYPATARAIARKAGLDAEYVMSGDELERCPEADLVHEVRRVSVFARIMPEQKLRIVQALKANGEVVAMTGDGVNDAPSLKAAHIGIAMGGRGTDVAREASSMVLLDDDFSSIVKAVRLGRRIYDNLRKAMGFIFAVHVPIAGLALLPLVFGLPIIFGPIHIAFLELVIDPVCTLVFEAEREEDDIMNRPPRDPKEPLFTGQLLLWSGIQGALAFALVAAIYVFGYRRGMPETETRALAFFSLVTAIIALILVNRSFSSSLWAALFRSNRILKYVLVAVVGASTLSLWWPVATKLFRFGPLHADDLAITVGAGFAVLGALELVKRFARIRLAA